MRQHEIVMLVDDRVAIRKVCTLAGPNHRTQALANLMQRRGEIQRVGRVRHLRGGRVAVDYIRLRPEREARRQLRIRALGLGASALTFLSTAAVAAWGARYALLILVGVALLTASLVYLATRGRHRMGCPGLHCIGCRH